MGMGWTWCANFYVGALTTGMINYVRPMWRILQATYGGVCWSLARFVVTLEACNLRGLGCLGHQQYFWDVWCHYKMEMLMVFREVNVGHVTRESAQHSHFHHVWSASASFVICCCNQHFNHDGWWHGIFDKYITSHKHLNSTLMGNGRICNSPSKTWKFFSQML